MLRARNGKWPKPKRKNIVAIEIEPNEINNKGTKNMCEYYGK